MPTDIRFTILDSYSNQWFQHFKKTNDEDMKQILAILLELTDMDKTTGVCPPPFCIIIEDKSVDFYSNKHQWDRYLNSFSTSTDLPLLQKRCEMSSILKSFFYENNSSTPGRKFPYRQLDSHEPSFDYIIAGEFAPRCISQMTVRQNYNKELILDQYLYKSKNILYYKNQDKIGVLFWPLVDIYELLEGEELRMKLKQVGVIL